MEQLEMFHASCDQVLLFKSQQELSGAKLLPA